MHCIYGHAFAIMHEHERVCAIAAVHVCKQVCHRCSVCLGLVCTVNAFNSILYSTSSRARCTCFTNFICTCHTYDAVCAARDRGCILGASCQDSGSSEGDVHLHQVPHHPPCLGKVHVSSDQGKQVFQQARYVRCIGARLSSCCGDIIHFSTLPLHTRCGSCSA